MEFEMKPYIVYVRTDAQDRITAINSSAFLRNTDGWTEIDSGYTQRHHHAQGNYLPKPITDNRGIYRYKLEDGKAVERTQEEMDADWVPPDPQPTQEERIAALEVENAQLKEALDLLLSGATEEAETDG